MGARRTLILLYAYKAYPGSEPVSPEFVPTPVPLTQDTYYGNSIWGDYYVTVAKRWLEAGYVNEVKGIAIRYPKDHPRYSPAGLMRITEGFDFYILEHIGHYRSIHQPSPHDVLFIRGQPPWEPIVGLHPSSFKIFYCARPAGDWKPRYPVDAILTDDPSWSIPGVRCVEMIKCCDEEIFQPLGLEKTYDVCFVARFERRSQKGQLQFAWIADKRWRTVFVGEHADPTVVATLRWRWPSCEILGHVTKARVNEILNRSRVSIVFTRAAEVGTRVILESLAAGTPVVIHKRNMGRKYVTPRAGEAAGSLLFRWKVAKAIRQFDRYGARAEYERRYSSRKVACELWERLGLK
ncbi:MAG: glycosyltransferase [Gemmatimonadota bacterium]